MKLRICLITPEFAPHRYGGIGCYVETLAKGLAARGHLMTVVGWKILPNEGVSQREWGQLVSLDWDWPFLWRFEGYIDPLATIRASVRLSTYFRQAGAGFDIVEAPNWRGDAALVNGLRCPLVVRVSSPSKECAVGPVSVHERLVMAAERALSRKARLRIAHSEAIARKAHEIYGTGDCTVIPLGMDAGAEPHLVDDATVDFVYVGRAEHRKGTDVMLAALRDAMLKNSRLRATLVGADIDAFTKRSTELAAVVSDLRDRCAGRFTEVTRADEPTKARLLMEADWLLMPSRFESFGLVALEAMRAGTPAILTRGSGLEEIGRQSPTTLFAEPGDYASLREGIERAVALGPHYKASVTQSIRRLFLDRFTAEGMVLSTETAYYQALDISKSPSKASEAA